MKSSIHFMDTQDEARCRRACVNFLIERHIVGAAEMGDLLGVTSEILTLIRAGHPTILGAGGVTTMDALMAIQSLLLDGYTPDTMERWFSIPSKPLGGMTPKAFIHQNGREGVRGVLVHAEALMS